MKKNIVIAIGSRANYSSIKSVIRSINLSKRFEAKILLFSASNLEKYGNLHKILLSDGFKIDHNIYTHLEGENLTTMAKSTGIALIEISTYLDQSNPDYVITIGDRYETIATAIASSYLNIKLIHTMGGEISGSIDESIRHAITKLAHIHFVASYESKKRVIKLGENPKNVFNVGCPRIDTVKDILKKKTNINILNNELNNLGVGAKLDLNEKFIILSYHPVTTEYHHQANKIKIVLDAIVKIKIQKIILWPNSDAGSNIVSKMFRKFRESESNFNARFFKNLEIEHYVQLMDLTSCLVGNSSSAIREGAYIGTPSVNIGSRQNNRERGKNVIDAIYDEKKIIKAIERQIKNKKFKSNNIYGDGNASKKILKILTSKKNLVIQKTIDY